MPSYTLAVLSCDRFVDDRDDGFWAAIDTPALPFHGVVHLGDQVYTDTLVAYLVSHRNYSEAGPLSFQVGSC